MPRLPLLGRVPALAELTAINSNVVAYWRFSGNANDDDPTASHLNITSGETFSDVWLAPGINGAWIGGEVERRAFDRTSIDASLQLNGNFTISCICTFNRELDSGANDGLVLLSVSNDAESSTTAFNGAGSGLRFLLGIVDEGWIGATLSNGAGAAETFNFNHEARLQEGVPAHVVLRRSGTTVEVYVNGTLVGSATATAATGNGTGTTVVVGRSLGTTRSHQGAIAALGLWSTALSAANIAALYKRHLVQGVRGDLAGGMDIDFEGPYTELFDTLTANRTLTFSNPVQGEVIFLQLTQDGTGGRTLTLPASAKVISGTFSTTANAVNHVGIYCVDEAAPKYLVTYRQE
jgi:hypothetical protein